MKKKPLFLVAAGLVLAWGLYRLGLAFVPEATRIRWQIESGLEAFNDARAGSIVDLLAEKYRDRDTGLDRRQLQLILTQFFHTLKQERGRMPYRAELSSAGPDAELVSIEIEDRDPPAAKFRLQARLFERAGKENASEEKPIALIEVSGRCVKEQGVWLLLESSHRTLEGRAPF